MDEKIDEAIKNSVAMIRANCKPDEALKFSQAALNLAHVKGQLVQVAMLTKAGKTKGAGS